MQTVYPEEPQRAVFGSGGEVARPLHRWVEIQTEAESSSSRVRPGTAVMDPSGPTATSFCQDTQGRGTGRKTGIQRDVYLAPR